MQQLLTPKEVCERLRVADNTLRKWRVNGVGPAYIKLGNGWNADVRYRLEDVEAWEKANRIITHI